MDSKLQRIPEIDVLKGMGIVLMVAGHVGFGSTFDFFIHSFHMPMFFIISGYLFNDSRSFGDFIKRKAKTLLVPYAVFGLLNLFAWILVNVVLGDQDVSSIASRLFHLCWVNTEGLPIAGALWFLTALFVAECVFYSLVVISQGELVSTFALSLLCSCFGRALSGVEGVPFGIDSGLVGVGLLGVGHALNKVGGALPVRTFHLTIFTAACLIIGICVTFANTNVNMRTGTYGSFVLFYVAATFMTMGLYGFATLVPHWWFRSELEYIGANSLAYVCLNQLVILVVFKFLVALFSGLVFSTTTLVQAITLVVSLALLHICAQLLTKHLGWALGRF